MKAPCDGIIDKQLFIKIRNQFPQEYKSACDFYNTYSTKDMIKISEDIINKITRKRISEFTQDMALKLTLENQYKSLYKAIDDSYDNINKETIENLVDYVSDIDEQTLNLRLIVKGLIILQAIYNMTDIVYTTIENNNRFSYLTEHKCVDFIEILKHIYDCKHIDDNSIDFMSDDNAISTALEQLNKKINDKLILLESEDDSIEFTEEDLFEDDYDSNQLEDGSVSYDSSDLDSYIHKLYYKSMYMLKTILNTVIDKDYKLLPNVNLIMYWVIIILMHYCLKF